MNLPDNLGKYKYLIRQVGNKIQLTTIFEINSAVISPINYLDLKEYYNQVIIKGSEQVVLAKASNEQENGANGK